MNKNEEHFPRDWEDLIEMMGTGYRPKFLFFWGNKVPTDGSVAKTCLSQWYPAGFEIDEVPYLTAEHFMMAEKARLFGDVETEKKILQSTNPGHAKKLGRQVKGYDEAKWVEHRIDAVVKGNVAKFGQNPELGEFLAHTNRRILVEASPVDRIWGIGLALDDERAENPDAWRGPNLLGFALMAAREQLSE